MKKKKKTTSIYEAEARRTLEVVKYIEQSSRSVNKYDVYVSGSQLNSGLNRKTVTGYQIFHNGRSYMVNYTSMSDVSLPKMLLQTVVRASSEIPSGSYIKIHTADSFTHDFINNGWVGPKTKEEANMILEQRKRQLCIHAEIGHSNILSDITNKCRNMMYK